MKRFWLAVLLLITLRLHGQELIYQTLTVDDGLPSNEIFCMMQDSKGYLWLGMDVGLCRYHGKEYQIYTEADGLPDNIVIQVREDSRGVMWLTTINNKLARLEKGRIEPYLYRLDPVPSDFEDFQPLTLIIGPEDQKWLIEPVKCLFYKEEKPGVFSLKAGTAEKIQREKNQADIYDYPKGLESFPREVLELPGFIAKQRKDYANGEYILTYQLRNGDILRIDEEGSYSLRSTDGIQTGQLPVQFIQYLLEDHSGNLWICGANGTTRTNGHEMDEHEFFFGGKRISHILEDREGNFWLNHHGVGLYKISTTCFRSLKYRSENDRQRTISLISRNEKLWFSTNTGQIWSVDTAGKETLHYKDRRRPYDYYAFEILENDTLLLPGLMRVFKGNIVRDKPGIAGYGHPAFKCAELWKDTLYFGLSDGIGMTPAGSNQLHILPDFEERTNALLPRDEGLWIGSVIGLSLRTKEGFVHFGQSIPELSNRIVSLAAYGSDHLVIGTKSSGVLLFNKTDFTIRRLSSKTGIIGDIIRSVHVEENRIYVGTNGGLSILNMGPGTHIESIRNFNRRNGLNTNDILDITGFGSRIWLSTNSGIVYFNPFDIPEDTMTFGVYITSMSIGDSMISEAGLSDTVYVDGDNRDLGFNYKGISFNQGNYLKYHTTLVGYDQDTSLTLSESSRYANLPSGTFTYLVWAEDINGWRSSVPARITVVIPKRMYEHLWFQILLVVILSGTLWWISWSVSRRKRKQLQLRLQIADLRQQALAALMNPHFIFNSLSAIRHLLQTGKVDKADGYISRFSRLIRMNLESVHRGYILLEDEFKRLEDYLYVEKLRFGDKLNYSIHRDPALNEYEIEIPSMIFQPFVENAIWHGILPLDRPGQIIIVFKSTHPGFLEVYIEDDGVGIDSGKSNLADHHTSLSMEITRERLQLLSREMGRKFRIDIRTPESGRGTRVHVTIPVHEFPD